MPLLTHPHPRRPGAAAERRRHRRRRPGGPRAPGPLSRVTRAGGPRAVAARAGRTTAGGTPRDRRYNGEPQPAALQPGGIPCSRTRGQTRAGAPGSPRRPGTAAGAATRGPDGPLAYAPSTGRNLSARRPASTGSSRREHRQALQDGRRRYPRPAGHRRGPARAPAQRPRRRRPRQEGRRPRAGRSRPSRRPPAPVRAPC